MTTQIIHEDGEVIAAFTEDSRKGISYDLKEIEESARVHNLHVADLPMILDVYRSSSAVSRFLEKKFEYLFNTVASISFEHHGLRNGKPVYEVWHGFGPLSTSEGMKRAIKNKDRMPLHRQIKWAGFAYKPIEEYNMPMDDDVWDEAGLGKYLGRDVERVSLEAARNNDVPEPGVPCIVHTGLDELVKINRVYATNMRSLKMFSENDHILMISGSRKNRDTLTEIVHNYSYYPMRIGEDYFDRAACFSINGARLDWGRVIEQNFLAINNKITGKNLTLPEQTPALVNNPDLNRHQRNLYGG